MAAEESTVPWDDQTDRFVSAIDELSKVPAGKAVGLRELLLDPDEYLSRPGISERIASLRGSTEAYFKEMLADLSDEQKELGEFLADSDMYYTKINGIVASKAAAASVPYIEPYFVYLNTDTREEIIVERYSQDLDMLIGKLVGASNYAANISGTYEGHRLGSWLFSGAKTHSLTLRSPENVVMGINRSRDLLLGMLDSISAGVEAPPQKA